MNHGTLLAGLACFTIACTQTARAQDASTATGSPPTTVTTAGTTSPEQADPNDIIVTARKREESILRVPVIANVLTQDRLLQTQVVNLEDVTKQTPGFVLGQSVPGIGTQVSIRGVGTTALDPGIDQSVSLVIDGVQFTQGNAYSLGLLDMAQVEVLKGPQALFFGKNSPGGVISIRTADPGSRFEALARTAYEIEDNRLRLEGVLSGPVSDTLGLRLAGNYTHSAGGYFRNTTVVNTALGARQPPSRFGRGYDFALRGTAVWKPSSDFSARLKVNLAKQDYDGGGAFQLKSCPEGTTNYLPSIGVPLPSFFSPNEDCKVDRRVNIAYLDPAAFGGLPNGGTPFARLRQVSGSLELNYDLTPKLRVTSVTGVYDVKLASLFNASYFGSYSPFAAIKNDTRHDVTQELRLASDFDGALNFLVGGFYQDGEITDNAALPGNTVLGLPARLLEGTFDLHIKSASVFGQGRLRITPTLELAAGVRYTDERRRLDASTTSGGVTFFPEVPRLRSRNWSPEVTLTYTPTADLTLFGSVKQAYKSGSYNIVQPIFPGTDNSYGDERVRGGEVGLKTRLADRTINLNLAGYYYRFSGLQVGINQPAAFGIPQLSTVNAGQARVYGVDFDATWRPTEVPGLDLYTAVNWNKAKFTRFVGAPCAGGQTFAEGCDLVPRVLNPANPSDAISLATGNYFTDASGNPFQYAAQDLSGTPLSRAPVWQVTGGVDYTLPLANDRKLRLGVSGQYSSRYLTNVGRRPDFYQNAFAKLNANITLTGRDERWELAVIGNNLTDKLTTGTCFNANYAGGILFPGDAQGAPRRGPSGADEIYCSYGQGRELWLRLTIKN